MKHFTSDLHFNHNNIVKYCNRPVDLGDTEAHNEWIMSFFNNFKEGDELYILGDLWMKTVKLQDIIDFFTHLKTQGVILYIIIGNHDEPYINMFYEAYRKVFNISGLAFIKHYMKIKEGDKKIILSHYPFESWDSSHNGSIHLHGHLHGTGNKDKKNRYDVGIDVNHRLFTLKDFIQDA